MRPRPRPVGITIQLPPPPGRPGNGQSGRSDNPGDCTQNITGLGWSRTAIRVWSLVFVEPEVSEVVVLSSLLDSDDYERVYGTEDITLEVVDGLFDEEEDKAWEFAMTGTTCGCIPTWDVRFTYLTSALDDAGSLMQPTVAGDTLMLEKSGNDVHARGTWSISAICGGQTYGPILLTISGTAPPPP